MLAGGWEEAERGVRASQHWGQSGQSIALCVPCPFRPLPRCSCFYPGSQDTSHFVTLALSPSVCLLQYASRQRCHQIYSVMLFKAGVEVLPGLDLACFCCSLRWGS